MPKQGGTTSFGTFEDAPITLRRTGRKKSISLAVRDGCVAILAPQQVPDSEIQELVARKAAWLRRKLAKYAEVKRLTTRAFVDGETFMFLGERYPLQVRNGPKARAELEADAFVVHVRRSHSTERRARSIRAAFLRWYKAEAATLIEDRVRRYAARMNLSPGQLSFRDYTSMWGKCTGDGNLSFNWKLVMAPLGIVDYVVVHELAHLRFLNHSAEFWSVVETAMPDYRLRRKWLKDHGGTLAI